MVFSSSSSLKDWIAVMGCCIPTDRSNTSALHSRSPNYRKVKSRWKPTNPTSNFLLPILVITKPWWNVQQKSGLQETNEKAQQQKSYRAKLTKHISMSKQKASTECCIFQREIRLSSILYRFGLLLVRPNSDLITVFTDSEQLGVWKKASRSL